MTLDQAQGSQKGDVYSFAIIVQEIIYRKGVFYIGEEDLSPQGWLFALRRIEPLFYFVELGCFPSLLGNAARLRFLKIYVDSDWIIRNHTRRYSCSVVIADWRIDSEL